jgi:hypothetical protein
MLAVVEEKQEALGPQDVDERGEEGAIGLLLNAQRAGDGPGDEVGVAQGGQLDEPGAVRVAVEDVLGHAEGEARLPAPAGAGEGEQAGPVGHPDE